jgi:Xaa-Pro aminopeptidase
MFQSFENRSESAHSAARVSRLREEMKREGIDAFLVPHADVHQNEYLPANAERLAWLTGFTGSAGYAIVCHERAVLFVDGRYTLQASRQADLSVFTIESLIDNPPSKWLEANAGKGWRIGFDPWLVTLSQEKANIAAASRADAEMVPVANLVDRIWSNMPEPPLGPVTLRDSTLSGEETPARLARLRKAIADAGASHCLLTDTTSIAWAFNIRGSDVAHIPVTLAFALIGTAGESVLFVDGRKLSAQVREALSALARIAGPEEMEAAIAACADGATFLCDPAITPVAIARAILANGGRVVEGRDTAVLPRAIKNRVEIEGARAAHRRDGVAFARFLAWMDAQAPGSLDEIAAATRLEEIRRDTALSLGSQLKEISFDTISGAGANGAIVHYRVTTDTNARLEDGSLYLVDSGAQYEDGTTDITRTLAIGAPPQGAARDYTLVLKGHIAISRARFPAGTRGMDIDAFARAALWREGKDYAHGTGHGVGSYLSVHEGPQSISKRGTEPLKAGMILSNEPGFYREGAYGIRIENLVLVRDCEKECGGFLEFETLTLAPYDLRLVDANLLDAAETAWIDAYHARVRAALTPHLDAAEVAWLERATRSLRA